jgi:hypothetical protein
MASSKTPARLFSAAILIPKAPPAFFSFSHILILQTAPVRFAASMAVRSSLREML